MRWVLAMAVSRALSWSTLSADRSASRNHLAHVRRYDRWGERSSAVSARASAAVRRDRPRAPARPTPGSAASRASMSAAVVSGPSVKRSAPRASASRQSHREQHVRRLGHAGLAGRTGRDREARDVEQEQQRVALAAGKVKWALPGRRPVGSGSPRRRRPARARMPCDQPVAQASSSRAACSARLVGGELGGDAERDGARRRPAFRSARAAGCRRASAARPSPSARAAARRRRPGRRSCGPRR